jgi:hypothetical protein
MTLPKSDVLVRFVVAVYVNVQMDLLCFPHCDLVTNCVLLLQLCNSMDYHHTVPTKVQ